MAINPETQYPGKIAPGDADYPYGSARNITTPGDGTGTPWEAAIVNDLLGFQQALLSAAGVVPSGTPDKVTGSQYLEALSKTHRLQRDTLAAAVALKHAKAGMVVSLTERTSGNGGGATWLYVDIGAVTPNEIDIVTCTGNPALALFLLDRETQFIDAFGAVQGADSSATMQYVATLGIMNFYPLATYQGAFTFDNDLIINGNEATLEPVAAGKLIKNATINISLKVNKLNAELGTTHQLPSDGFIETDECTEVAIHGCKIREGGRHVWSKKSGKIRWTDNQSLSSQDWGLYFEGASDFIIDNNIAANCATHDGIKGGGVTSGTVVGHVRGIISNNICRGNFRDGIDCAINGGSNIEITGNLCYENIEKGIDLKVLNYPAGGQSNIEHLLIANNIIEFDATGSGGISIQNNDDANVDFRDSVIEGNYLESSAIQMEAIRLESCDNINVQNNTITNFFYGIRCVNASINNNIHDNTINAAIPFRLEDQGDGIPTGNRFYRNDCNQFTQFANSNTAQVIDGDANEFFDNTITKDPTSQYSLQAENLGTAATNTLWYNNSLGFTQGAPLGVRIVVGDIFIDSAPIDGSPEKWVAKTQTASSNLPSLHGVSQRGFRTNAGDPNGSVAANFIGEELYDSVNGRFWRTWSTGSNNWV